MKQTLENFQELSTNQKFLEYIATETTYTYVRTLQKGSESILYLLENRRTHERVVLKRMRKKTLKRSKYRARYECELDALQHMQHAHIPQLLMSGEVARVPYKLLTYIQGTPLAKASPYSNIEALTLIARVSAALKPFHAQGYVHGHLTPEHILVEGETVQFVGLDYIAVTTPHPTMPYKVKKIAHDIDQLARLFLALTDTTQRFKWKKADSYVLQQMPPSPLQHILKQALYLKYEEVDQFITHLKQAI
jgi:tRNA A-37 threonylcarbamoyl transferase component Bud32